MALIDQPRETARPLTSVRERVSAALPTAVLVLGGVVTVGVMATPFVLAGSAAVAHIDGTNAVAVAAEQAFPGSELRPAEDFGLYPGADIASVVMQEGPGGAMEVVAVASIAGGLPGPLDSPDYPTTVCPVSQAEWTQLLGELKPTTRTATLVCGEDGQWSVQMSVGDGEEALRSVKLSPAVAARVIAPDLGRG